MIDMLEQFAGFGKKRSTSYIDDDVAFPFEFLCYQDQIILRKKALNLWEFFQFQEVLMGNSCDANVEPSTNSVGVWDDYKFTNKDFAFSRYAICVMYFEKSRS